MKLNDSTTSGLLYEGPVFEGFVIDDAVTVGNLYEGPVFEGWVDS